MNRWTDNWDCISLMFKFSQTARKVMYTPNAMGLTKALYLATWELMKKWALPVRNWGQIYAELAIMYPGSLSGD